MISFSKATADADVAEAFDRLSEAAWAVRESASIIGKTKVGCALQTSSGVTVVGCNIEQRFRSHDVHAEVNAISSMVAAGEREITYLLVVADRRRFTPCGACMDWIMQFAAPNCLVAFQPLTDEPPTIYRTHELMPHDPQ